MSAAQKVRKNSPVKQGPMKATIPMASLLRHSSNLRKSPILSPTGSWRNRISPDHAPSGQRSPGALSYKAKSRTLGVNSAASNGNIIRRTASLDTIYLRGQWPRENFYFHTGLLQIDKATQTEDYNLESRNKGRLNEPFITDDKLEKLFRQRLQRNTKEGSSRERMAAFGLIVQNSSEFMPNASSQTNNTSNLLTSPASRASPVNIPIKPIAKPPMRNSIEGLNQEIERLVLKATSNFGATFSDKNEEDKFQQITPEGHRAPLADLLRSTRSVNTQTPGTSDLTGSYYSSGPPSRESCSPLIPGHLDVSRPSSEQDESQGSSPDQESTHLGTSPHINRFLAREPPDGCEKVNLRFMETRFQPFADTTALDYCPLKPCMTFQLKPSLGSAFYPLQPVASAMRDGSPIERATSASPIAAMPLVPPVTEQEYL